MKIHTWSREGAEGCEGKDRTFGPFVSFARKRFGRMGMTIELRSRPPGIGSYRGLILESPERFADARAAGPYLGLVPERDQSGKSDRQLGITSCSDARLAYRFIIMSIAELRKLPADEKLRIIEALWGDVAADDEAFQSPAWHEAELRKTEADLAAGRVEMLDWGDAKKELRKRFE